MFEADPMLTAPGTAGNPGPTRAFPRDGARHHEALLWSVWRRTWCGVWATPFGHVPAYTTRFTPRPKPHVIGPPAVLTELLTPEQLRMMDAVFVAPEWRHLI